MTGRPLPAPRRPAPVDALEAELASAERYAASGARASHPQGLRERLALFATWCAERDQRPAAAAGIGAHACASMMFSFVKCGC